MTPKERAIYLLKKYSESKGEKIPNEVAKSAVQKTVDILIESSHDIWDDSIAVTSKYDNMASMSNYWKLVKQEIEQYKN